MGFLVEPRHQNAEMKCQDVRMGPMNYTRHKRSKSHFLEGETEEKWDSSPKSFHHLKLDVERAKGQFDIKGRRSADSPVQVSLKKEIHQLKKWLEDQFVVRHALEKALGYRSSTIDTSNDSSMPKPTKELIREIAVLEVEVMHLEKHLLSLYRKTFDPSISTLHPITHGGTLGKSFMNPSGLIQVQSSRILLPRTLVNEACNINLEEKLTCRAVHRTHSSLPQRSVCSSRGLRPCQSLPFTFVENATTSGVISLADYLGTSITDHVPETPSKLSEDMVRCMGAIYCRLAEPPVVHHGLASSPSSSFSSMSASSPRYMGDMWSPGCKRESMLDARLDNPFRVEGLKEFSGPYNAMVEVSLLCIDKRRISDAKGMIQNYKLLVQRLEKVDPRSMKNEEKLAFWINIHNALIMHAYLQYGLPQNSMKKANILSKVTYMIGGRTINADIIQGSILGCRIYHPGQWLRVLFSRKIKLKDKDEWQSYGVEHPQPLLHFALCSGSHSDPAVRIYTSKKVMHQLEAAKEEYIRASIGIQKEQKILLPKMIDYYAKETSLSLQGVLDMIQQYLPESLQMVMRRCQQGRPHKIVEWVPYNFSFRYLLSRELAVHLTN